MKKILAVLLAAIMLLSLAACGLGSTENPNNDDPGTSQSDGPGSDENQSSENANNSGEGSGPKAFSWPAAEYIKDYMKYNGNGTVVFVKEDPSYAGYPATWIYIDGATLEEIETYLSVIKAEGFAYQDRYAGTAKETGEPTVEFGGWDSSFSWDGQLEGTGYIGLRIYENVNTTSDYADDELIEFSYNFKLFITTQTVDIGYVILH